MGRLGLATKYYVKKDENGANSDGGISDIEGRPGIESLPGKEMKIDLDEIGDRAVENAIREVARGAAEKKSEAGSVHGADSAACDEQPDDDRDDGEGASDEDCAQGRRGQTGEKTEGNAGIAGINEIKVIANHRSWEVICGARFDPCFGGTVEEDDGEGEPQEAKASGKSHEREEVKEVKEINETKGATTQIELRASWGLRLAEKRLQAPALQMRGASERGSISTYRHSRGAGGFDFGKGFGAALADGGVAGVFANVR
jgi:hypothetical protein